MELDLRMILMIALPLGSLVAAWFGFKYGLKAVEKDIAKIYEQLERREKSHDRLWERVEQGERFDTDMNVRVARHDALLNVDRMSRDIEDRAEQRAELRVLRRDIDRLSNGK